MSLVVFRANVLATNGRYYRAGTKAELTDELAALFVTRGIAAEVAHKKAVSVKAAEPKAQPVVAEPVQEPVEAPATADTDKPLEEILAEAATVSASSKRSRSRKKKR